MAHRRNSSIPNPDDFDSPLTSPLDTSEQESLIRSASPPRISHPEPPSPPLRPPPRNFHPPPLIDDPPPPYKPRHPKPPSQRRQSSFAQPRQTPRTSNRVRFDVDEPRHQSLQIDPQGLNGHIRNISAESAGSHGSHGSHGSISFLEDDDPLYSRQTDEADEDDERHMNGYANGHGQRLPLLTGVEAPSVTLASGEEWEGPPESLLESARPKSGVLSAFMNMANSIMCVLMPLKTARVIADQTCRGAGIIGQPYALRQAGLIAGVVLLVVLTVIVDWTIRLIVINAKLSGASSFQTTMQKCFGRSGLIAISLAQWLLYVATIVDGIVIQLMLLLQRFRRYARFLCHRWVSPVPFPRRTCRATRSQ